MKRDFAAELIALVEKLPVHSIDGYEWDCSVCHFHWLMGINAARPMVGRRA